MHAVLSDGYFKPQSPDVWLNTVMLILIIIVVDWG